MQSSTISLGTAAIGRPHYINIRTEVAPRFDLPIFKKRGIATLEDAYQRGIRYFDTAPGYGIAEQILIEWIKATSHQDIEIATKWGYTYTANFNPDATQHEVKEHSLSKLNEQWQSSKALLPFLSTYQIHSATLETGVLENEDVLNRLYELKQTRQLLIGISTTGTNQVQVIQKALEVEVQDEPLFDTFQVTYNILDQSLERMAATLHQLNKRIIIKEALANGRFFPNERFPKYQGLYQLLQQLSTAYQVGIDAIALRFCMDQLKPFTVLSGASQPTHLKENLQANTFTLKEEDLERLSLFQVEPAYYWSERKGLQWN